MPHALAMPVTAKRGRLAPRHAGHGGHRERAPELPQERDGDDERSHAPRGCATDGVDVGVQPAGGEVERQVDAPFSAALTALSFFFASQSSPSQPPKAATASTTTVAMVRAGSVGSEAVLALAAWMAWAEGGVHARPAATLLPYAAQLGAQLAWAPFVLGHAATRAGLACCAAMACARGFCAVNPVAGDLAKPAVAWAVILAVVNYKML